MENKKSFLLYTDIIHTFNELTDEQIGKLMRHVVDYVNDLNPETIDIVTKISFAPIKQYLKRDLLKYNDIVEKKSLAGKASAESRKQNQQMLTGVNISEHLSTVSDIDIVIVNDKDNINKTLLSEIKISDLKESEIEYFNIAIKFQKLFIKNLEAKRAPTFNQKRATYNSYVTPIRLMFESDKITTEQLKDVFNFLDSPIGEFWKINILSINKLREKFTQLVMKANEINNKPFTKPEEKSPYANRPFS